jgi:hypothetical protein
MNEAGFRILSLPAASEEVLLKSSTSAQDQPAQTVELHQCGEAAGQLRLPKYFS